jgi:NADH-quinone oxidoreductase subunit L
LGAFLTAYYTFRLLFVLWFPRGDAAAPAEAEHDAHGHEGEHHSAAGYWVMAVPLIILAGFTVFLGFFSEKLVDFLHWGSPPPAAHHPWLAAVAIVLVAAGVGLAWLEFGRPGARQEGFLARLPAMQALFANRWYMDAFYRRLVDYVVYGLFSRLFTLNDRRVVDGAIDGVCRGTVGTGWLLSFVQSGLLQYNLFTMVLIIALIGLYFLLA